MKTHNKYKTAGIVLAMGFCLGVQAERNHSVEKTNAAPGVKAGASENVNANRETNQEKSAELQKTQTTDDYTSAKGVQVKEGGNSMTLKVGANGMSETFEGTWREPTAQELADLKTDSGLSVKDMFSNGQVKVFEPKEAIAEGALFKQTDAEDYLRPSDDMRNRAKSRVFTLNGRVVGGGGGGGQAGEGAGQMVKAASAAGQ